MVLFLYLLLFNFNKILVYTIIILEYTTFIFAHPKFVYLLNPYKRIKTLKFTTIAKCGKYICFETKSRTKALLDYNNFTIKNIKFNDDGQNVLFEFCFSINDKLILFYNSINKRYKVYDVEQDKVIKDSKYDVDVYYQPIKVGDNLYYTFRDEYLYKWKYNFELNKVDILNKKDIKYLGKLGQYRIINDKLYIRDVKKDNNIHPSPPSNVSIYIYQ